MTATTFLLVRHAHADWTADEMRPLSEVGRAQAERLCDRLASERPRAIYSSPYLRARQTVEPLSRRLDLPVRVMWDLRERSLALEPVEDWLGAIRRTWEDFSVAFPTDGECNREVMARARRTLDTLRDRHQEDTVVVATHGNLLTLLLRCLDPAFGFEFWRRIETPDLFRWTVGLEGQTDLERLSIPS